jgi:DNA-binding transcriptional regulator LsrR (DeoR family)
MAATLPEHRKFLSFPEQEVAMSSDSFSAHELQQVAGLFCEGMSLQDIVSTLPGRNESDIWQMLQRALREGYFHYQPVLSINNMSKELRNFLNNETLTKTIAEALSTKLELRNISIRITRSPERMFECYQVEPITDEEKYREYLKAESASLEIIGRRVATELSRRLFDGKQHIVGLNYGASVLLAAKQLSPLPSQVSQMLTVVSLFGDIGFHIAEGPLPLLKGNVPLASNDIVALLANRLGPMAKAELLNVPAFIPYEFTLVEDTFRNIHNFLTSHSSYTRIFGTPYSVDKARNPDALVTKMDTIITGFGSADNYTVLQCFLPAWLSTEETETILDHCRSGAIVGDIGGHLVTSPLWSGNTRSLNQFLSRINQRLIAANPIDFLNVADRHAMNRNTGAGVVGVAAGGRKARILHALLAQERCPLSMLFIDTFCALALLNLIDSNAYRVLIHSGESGITPNRENWSIATKQLLSM